MGETHLTPSQVAEKLQISERSLKRWTKEGRFPKGVEISRECIRWPESVVDKWMIDKMEANQDETKI